VPDRDVQAVLLPCEVLDHPGVQLAASEGSGEAQAEQAPVAPTDQRVIAAIQHLADDGGDRRLFLGDRSAIEAVSARSLVTGDVCELPVDIIHSVTNPLGKLTAGIHIYGGDFFASGMSHWNGEALTEGPRQHGPVHNSLSEG
jgi:hypothetical protein